MAGYYDQFENYTDEELAAYERSIEQTIRYYDSDSDRG